MLGQHAERRVLLESAALASAVLVELRIAGEAGPQEIERPRFESKHRVTVDAPANVQILAGPCERLQVELRFARTRHVRDVKVQRVAEAAARRVVGTRLLWHARNRRRERVHQKDASAQPERPRAEPAKISQVTDAPARRRSRRVELGGPAPGAPRWLRARRRRDDHAGLTRASPERVVARRDAGGHRAADRFYTPVLELQLTLEPQPGARARAEHPDGSRGWPGFGSIGAHRLEQRSTSLRRCFAPIAEGADIARRDPPGVRRFRHGAATDRQGCH